MEPVSVKFEDSFLQALEKVMKKHRYATKAEFIRQAVREKIKELEKEEALAKVKRLYGASRLRTTDEELHKAGEKTFQEIERGFK